MDQRHLFRKAALDKLASPDQLDVLMEVTSPKGWLALWTVGGILLVVMIWGVFGSIPTRVEGEGILIRGGSLREIEADGDGVLMELSIALSEQVEEGQVIGKIALPDLEDRIRTARMKFEQLERDHQAGTAEDRATITGHRADLRRTQAELEKLNQQLAVTKKAYDDGLITRNQLLTVERDKVGVEATITQQRATIRQIEQRLRQRKIEVDAARRAWEELESTGERVSSLTSTVSGRVIELKKNVGDQVSDGEVVAVLEPSEGSLEPIVYVSSTQGKMIRHGMEAQISPYNVKKEEYGYMKAAVTQVGEYPVTPEAAVSVVANEALARELLGSLSKIEVRAQLMPTQATPSGYEWSSSKGPPFKVAGGTRIMISVIVDRRAPITYVLPIVRSTLGAS
jgi:HlyD family secretion protein